MVAPARTPQLRPSGAGPSTAMQVVSFSTRSRIIHDTIDAYKCMHATAGHTMWLVAHWALNLKSLPQRLKCRKHNCNDSLMVLRAPIGGCGERYRKA